LVKIDKYHFTKILINHIICVVNSEKANNQGDYTLLLKSHGVYPTSQRLAIAGVVFERFQHLTADEIYDRVKVVANVSRATVYNTLGLFSEQGLVREIKADSSKTFYDSNTSRHHHFFNIDTGELSDFDPEVFSVPSPDTLPNGTELHSIDVVVRVKNTPEPRF
jgi:Fur family iron response transcriptional regulator